jgi:hypothetical protein
LKWSSNSHLNSEIAAINSEGILRETGELAKAFLEEDIYLNKKFQIISVNLCGTRPESEF